MKLRLFLFGLLVTCSTLFAQTTVSGPGAYNFRHPEAKATWTATLPKDIQRISETCVVSPSEKRVYLLAELCGLGEGYECEFVLLSALSDRAYESIAIAWDTPEVLNQAMAALGAPKGVPANSDRGLAMAKGERFTISLQRLGKDDALRPLSDFLSDTCSTPAQALLERGFPYVGEEGFADVMPAALIAAYTEQKSSFGLPYHAPKSAVYGCFRATSDEQSGTPTLVALHWQQLPNALSRVYNHEVTLNAEALQQPDTLLNELRKLCEDPRDVFLRVKLDPSLKLAEVVPMAKLLLALEAEGGFSLDAPQGTQLPLRAFLPEERWRQREGRVFQPWEVEFKRTETGLQVTLCQILEDWTVEGMEPALTRKCYPEMTPQTIDKVMQRIDVNDGKIYVAFFYVTPEITVGDILPFADAIKAQAPTQWIFIDKPNPVE